MNHCPSGAAEEVTPTVAVEVAHAQLVEGDVRASHDPLPRLGTAA